MRTVWLKLSIFAPKKLYGGRTVNRSEIPHYAYTWPLAVIQKDHETYETYHFNNWIDNFI